MNKLRQKAVLGAMGLAVMGGGLFAQMGPMPASAPATGAASAPATSPASMPATMQSPIALADMTVPQLMDELLRQMRLGRREETLVEVRRRGDAIYDALLKIYRVNGGQAGPSAAAGVALAEFPKFADVLLEELKDPSAGHASMLLAQMKTSAVPAMLRALGSADEGRRAVALTMLLRTGRRFPDETDLLFGPILTANAEVKPRLIAAQGLVTGLWPREAQEAVVQQVAHGDAAMVAAILQGVDQKGITLNDAGAKWAKALADAKDATTTGRLLHLAEAVRADDITAAAGTVSAGIRIMTTPEAIAAWSEDGGEMSHWIATLRRSGAKGSLAVVQELLKSKEPRVRGMGIECCRQLDADAAPAVKGLTDILGQADTQTEEKRAVLASLAAIGPAARGAVTAIRNVNDEALATEKKHALLMIQDGWTPTVVAEWKPVRARHIRFVPRAGADAELAAAGDAAEALRADIATAPGVTPPEVAMMGMWRLIAMCGGAEDAMKLPVQGANARQKSFLDARALAYGAAAQLRVGKKDQAADWVTRSIGRYHLGLMTGEPATADVEFSAVAIAMLATGDLEGAGALAAKVPVDRTTVVKWQAEHGDLDGAMETATETPYGQDRLNALAAAGNALGDAGRVVDAGRMFSLGLDAMHGKSGLAEQELSDMASGVALCADNGLTPAMLKGFYSADDRDLSMTARLEAISTMTDRGLLDGAVQLGVAAPAADPEADPAIRLQIFYKFLRPAMAMGPKISNSDVMALCDKVRREMEPLYAAGAKRPAGRDAAFNSAYLETAVYLTQVYLYAGQPRDAAGILEKSSPRVMEGRPTLADNFDWFAGAIATQQAEAHYLNGVMGLLEKISAGAEKVQACCFVAEAQYPQDQAAAQRTWAMAELAGAGADDLATSTTEIKVSRARARAGMAVITAMEFSQAPWRTAAAAGANRQPASTQPAANAMRYTAKIARGTKDPAARIDVLERVIRQSSATGGVPVMPPLSMRVPADVGLLMREAESQLAGVRPEVMMARSEALDACVRAGMTDGLEGRMQSLAAGVAQLAAAAEKQGATSPVQAAAPVDRGTALRAAQMTLALLQGATGHVPEAEKWIDGVKDAGTRLRLRYAVVRGVILRTQDFLLGAVDGQ